MSLMEQDIHYIEQPLDHFNFQLKKITFKQRFLINDQFYQTGKEMIIVDFVFQILHILTLKGGPVFLWVGSEEELSPIYIQNSLLSSMAPNYHALLVLVEHRYYGKSTPFQNPTNEQLQYLSIQQVTLISRLTRKVLMDYAKLVAHINNQLGITGPWFTFGGSYGG
jgi:hypothetical protein